MVEAVLACICYQHVRIDVDRATSVQTEISIEKQINEEVYKKTSTFKHRNRFYLLARCVYMYIYI